MAKEKIVAVYAARITVRAAGPDELDLETTFDRPTIRMLADVIEPAVQGTFEAGAGNATAFRVTVDVTRTDA